MHPKKATQRLLQFLHKGLLSVQLYQTRVSENLRLPHAKRDLFGKTVVNDKNEKIGKVDDLIISPSKAGSTPAASFAIIGVGGFLGMGKRELAVPTEQLKLQNKQLTLPGATKDALKALPPFVYQSR